MKVSEFIEWLKTQDQDAIVQVMNSTPGHGWEAGDIAGHAVFTATQYKDFDYIDFRGNKFAKPEDPYYNQRYLELGQKD